MLGAEALGGGAGAGSLDAHPDRYGETCVCPGQGNFLLASLDMNNHAPITASISVEREHEMVMIHPCAVATSAGQYAYRLKARKTGASGSSNNGQSGRVMLKPGEQRCFGSVTLNLGPNDHLDVRLELLDGQVVVATDHFTI